MALPAVLRAAGSTYLVLFAIWAAPSGLVLEAGLRHPSAHGLAPMLGIIALYGLTLFLWAARFRVELFDDRLIHTSLFGGRRQIARADIGKVTRPVGLTRYTDRFLPPVRLEISQKSNPAKKLIINLKPLSPRAIAQLLSYLNP